MAEGVSSSSQKRPGRVVREEGASASSQKRTKGSGMAEGSPASSPKKPEGAELAEAGLIDLEAFPVVEALPCFDKGKVGAPLTVNLARVLLPTGEALEDFVSNIHRMGGVLQPFMGLAVGAEAGPAERFGYRDAGARVAASQRDCAANNRCAGGCREMARLVLLANHRALRTWKGEWVILPTVPGAAQPPPFSAPKPVAPTEGGDPVPENRGSSRSEQASTKSPGAQGREAALVELREAAGEPRREAGLGGGAAGPEAAQGGKLGPPRSRLALAVGRKQNHEPLSGPS